MTEFDSGDAGEDGFSILNEIRYWSRNAICELSNSIRPSPSPCKTFARKKSLACYALKFDPSTNYSKHKEIYRIVNRKPHEYYVLPRITLLGQSTLHYSYHRSGKFHWKHQGEPPIVPLDGEADARNAQLICQAMNHFSGHLDGYCLALGPDTSSESLQTMLKILDGYIIPDLGIYDSLVLYQRRNFMIPFMMSPQREKAFEIVSNARSRNEGKVFSAAEVISTLRKFPGGDKAKIFIESPDEQRIAFKNDTMLRLIELARDLAANKIGEKGPKFWTPRRSTAKPQG